MKACVMNVRSARSDISLASRTCGVTSGFAPANRASEAKNVRDHRHRAIRYCSYQVHGEPSIQSPPSFVHYNGFGCPYDPRYWLMLRAGYVMEKWLAQRLQSRPDDLVWIRDY